MQFQGATMKEAASEPAGCRTALAVGMIRHWPGSPSGLSSTTVPSPFLVIGLCRFDLEILIRPETVLLHPVNEDVSGDMQEICRMGLISLISLQCGLHQFLFELGHRDAFRGNAA